MYAGARAVGSITSAAYHSWTYDLQGALLGAPHLKAMPDVAYSRL